jgi:hypothetical protein
MFTLLSERSPCLLTLTVAYGCRTLRALWEAASLCSLPAWSLHLDGLSESRMNISWRAQRFCIRSGVMCYPLFLPTLITRAGCSSLLLLCGWGSNLFKISFLLTTLRAIITTKRVPERIIRYSAPDKSYRRKN